MTKRKVALVHDFLINYGGAEGVLKTLSEMYHEAPIYTLLCDKEKTEKYLGDRKIMTSFLQRAPKFFRKRYKWLFPFMPSAPETFNLRDYDVVISSSSGFAKGVVLKPKTVHVCYMHAPMRYVWDWSHRYLEEQNLKGKPKLLTRLLLNYLRMWDRASAERVDHFIANSKYTARRIKKYYNKEATVIYPPVEVEKFTPQKEHGNYFLTVARLSPYKRVKLIVDVFNKLKLPLVVVGDGEERKEIEKEAKGNPDITILGFVDEEKKRELYQNARAFVFAAEDDFGIAPVEAMSAGKPVIAYRAGGIEETMIEGVTGEFFNVAQLEIVADAVRRFIENENNYNPTQIRKHADNFSKERFKKEIQEFIEKV